MKEFFLRLKMLGFRKINLNNYYANNGDLYYVVYLRKDRYSNKSVSLAVTTPGFFDGSLGANFYKSDRSPVWGWLGKIGVGDSVVIERLNGGDFDIDNAVDVIIRFFSQFGSVKELLAVSGVLPDFYPIIDGFVEDSTPCFDVTGGVLSEVLLKGKIQILLSSDAFREFGVEQVDDWTYAVKRNDGSCFYDCFYIGVDKFSTFITFQFFPWSTKFWSDGGEFDGDFRPFLRFWLKSDAGAYVKFTGAELLGMRDIEIIEFIKNGILLSKSVKSERDYVVMLSQDEDFSFVASKFIKFI